MFWNRKKKRVVTVDGLDFTLTRFLGNSKDIIKVECKKYDWSSYLYVNVDGNLHGYGFETADLEEAITLMFRRQLQKNLEGEITSRYLTAILNDSEVE